MRKDFFKLLLLLLLLEGCSVTPKPYTSVQLDHFAQQLHRLDTTIPYNESLRLARLLHAKSRVLIKRYALTSPPVWHNFLVNIGLKEKGLCYHWSNALYITALQGNFPHYRFHKVGANIGEYWSEHNALAITVEGQKVVDGLLVDAWRDSGRLYVCRVKEDTHYLWRVRNRITLQSQALPLPPSL